MIIVNNCDNRLSITRGFLFPFSVFLITSIPREVWECLFIYPFFSMADKWSLTAVGDLKENSSRIPAIVGGNPLSLISRITKSNISCCRLVRMVFFIVYFLLADILYCIKIQLSIGIFIIIYDRFDAYKEVAFGPRKLKTY